MEYGPTAAQTTPVRGDFWKSNQHARLDVDFRYDLTHKHIASVPRPCAMSPSIRSQVHLARRVRAIRHPYVMNSLGPMDDSFAYSSLERAYATLAMAVHRAQKLGVIVATPRYRAALRYGVAAATEHHRSPHIPTPASILDVGANRGQFALVARHRFPSAALLCFEPLPEPRGRLERIMRGTSDVQIFPYALGQASATVTFRVTTDDDSSSILPATSIQRSLSPGSALNYETQVEVRRLDEVLDIQRLPRPIFLKIDVQGTELDVLRGAGALAELVDDILVECSFLELYEGQALAADVVDFLNGWGLRMSGVHNVVATPDGRSAQADLHFSRSAA